MKPLLFISCLFVVSILSAQVQIDSIRTVINGSWPVYKTEGAEEPSSYFGKGEVVTIVGYGVDRFQIKYWSSRRGSFLIGFINTYAFDGLDDLKKQVSTYSENRREENRKAIQAEVNKRNRELVAKFGKVNASRINNSEYWIGMTKEMAELSLGKPEKINRTVTEESVSEQWVYPGVYLYFKNGKVVSFQD
jgi:hypothetical protein